MVTARVQCNGLWREDARMNDGRKLWRCGDLGGEALVLKIWSCKDGWWAGGRAHSAVRARELGCRGNHGKEARSGMVAACRL
jgi:hypothetical protein